MGRSVSAGIGSSTRGPRLRIRLLAAVILGATFTVAPPRDASAFGTAFFQEAVHEKITRWAFAFTSMGPDTLDQLAGTPGAYGAIGYPDQNPLLIFSSDAHCDNGDIRSDGDVTEAQKNLEACRDNMADLMQRAIDAAGGLADEDGTPILPDEPLTDDDCDWTLFGSGRSKCQILLLMGRVFHVSQDFYSHSNWTDLDDGQDTISHPKGLQNDKPSPFMAPDGSGKYADAPGLRSGCFLDGPLALCFGRTSHGDLNKDKGKLVGKDGIYVAGQGLSDRGRISRVYNDVYEDNFQRAVHAAVLDAREKWEYFEKKVLEKYNEPLAHPEDDMETRGDRIICLMKADYPRECDSRLP